jgi:hypothetical protein
VSQLSLLLSVEKQQTQAMGKPALTQRARSLPVACRRMYHRVSRCHMSVNCWGPRFGIGRAKLLECQQLPPQNIAAFEHQTLVWAGSKPITTTLPTSGRVPARHNPLGCKHLTPCQLPATQLKTTCNNQSCGHNLRCSVTLACHVCVWQQHIRKAATPCPPGL